MAMMPALIGPGRGGQALTTAARSGNFFSSLAEQEAETVSGFRRNLLIVFGVPAMANQAVHVGVAGSSLTGLASQNKAGGRQERTHLPSSSSPHALPSIRHTSFE